MSSNADNLARIDGYRGHGQPHHVDDDHGALDNVPLPELRAEAERLIAAMDRPVRRITLRAGNSIVELEWQDPQVHLVQGGQASTAAPAQVTQPQATAIPSAPASAVAASTNTFGVVAPLVGTFYRSPSPGSPPFAEVGDVVRAGQQLAIVEAMKLMTPINADRTGRIVAIKVDDGEMVEFEQQLFELEPVDSSEG